MVDTDSMVSRMVFSRRVLTKIAIEIPRKTRSAIPLLILSRRILANHKQDQITAVSNLSDDLKSGMGRSVVKMVIPTWLTP